MGQAGFWPGENGTGRGGLKAPGGARAEAAESKAKVYKYPQEHSHNLHPLFVRCKLWKSFLMPQQAGIDCFYIEYIHQYANY